MVSPIKNLQPSSDTSSAFQAGQELATKIQAITGWHPVQVLEFLNSQEFLNLSLMTTVFSASLFLLWKKRKQVLTILNTEKSIPEWTDTEGEDIYPSIDEGGATQPVPLGSINKDEAHHAPTTAEKQAIIHALEAFPRLKDGK